MAKYCTNCGTELDPTWKACPNCGATLEEGQPQIPPLSQPSTSVSPPSYAPTYARTYSAGGGTNYGVAALICGIIGLCFFGIVLGIVAIILGTMGMKRDANTSAATAGLILGILAFACNLIGLFLLASYFWIWPI